MSTPTESAPRRRVLSFTSLDDVVEEVNCVVFHHERCEVSTSGNWTTGQILQHVGKLVQFSLDGFSFRTPWHLRAAATLLKWLSWKHLLRVAFRPGFQLPAGAAALLPDTDVSVHTAASFLIGQIYRVQQGERMTQPSPFDGTLTHQQWVEGHLRHAELHLSFIHYGPDTQTSEPGHA